MSLKNKIISLRNNGKTYDEIKDELNCSKATISYHCQRNNLGGNNQRSTLTDDEIVKLNEYYKNHTIEECVSKFKIGKSTVTKHTDNKRELNNLTKEEKKVKNYKRVKSHRQKIKEKSIEYKGNKCEKCGYDKCKWAFDFHHTDSKTKDFTISKYSTLSWDRIKKELDKCILVCANCHREIHYEEEQNKLKYGL